MTDTALTLWGLYKTHIDSGFNGAGSAVYPTIVRFKTSWWAWSTWRNRLCTLSCKMWSESTLTASKKKPDWCIWLLLQQGGGGRWDAAGTKWGVHGCDEMYFTEVFMMTDGLQIVGIVSYANLVIQGFSNVRLRPELWDLGCIGLIVYRYGPSIATVQSGPKMSPGFKLLSCISLGTTIQVQEDSWQHADKENMGYVYLASSSWVE